MEWRQVTKEDVGKKMELHNCTNSPHTILCVGNRRYFVRDKEGNEASWGLFSYLVRPYVEPLNVKVGDLVLAERKKNPRQANLYLGIILSINVNENIIRIDDIFRHVNTLCLSEWTFRKILTEE